MYNVQDILRVDNKLITVGRLHSVCHSLQAPCGGLLPNLRVLLEGRQLPSIEMKITGPYDIWLQVLTVLQYVNKAQ
jgi:hypothetical protein